MFCPRSRRTYLTRAPAGAFQTAYPSLYAYYAEAYDAIAQKCAEEGSPIQRPFYPFASVGVNCHPTVCVRHRDGKNVVAGVCCIVPFGTFDSRKARLVLEELNLEVEVAAGVPIFIPSAVFHHWNTALEGAGVRGSVAYWTGSSLFQWHDLGYRALNSFSSQFQNKYSKEAAARVRKGLDRFPTIALQ